VDELDSIKLIFFQECEELLADLETGLGALNRGDADPETINAVFRAVHSVKGGAGAFGFDALVRFAHVLETLLDELRSGRNQLSPEITAALLEAGDVLADLVTAARDGGESGSAAEGMVERLDALCRGGSASACEPVEPDITALLAAASAPAAVGEVAFDFKPAAITLVDLDWTQSEARPEWNIHFRPFPALYANASEPAALLRELQGLGEAEVVLDWADTPALEAADADGAWLSWTVKLRTGAGEAAIREIFEFVEGACELTVTLAGGVSAEATGARLDLERLLASAQAASETGPEEQDAAPMGGCEPSKAALDGPAFKAVKATSIPEAQPTIRVEPARIDRLIDLVGELIINQAMLAQRVTEAGLGGATAVSTGLDDLEQLTRELQDSVMAIRAQPVRSVFQRLPRLARETAAMTGKSVRLVVEGEGTEVDKTVIERLAEPLTHMLRNAIDHGLESPVERLRVGKPEEGVVRVAALHRGGRIVVEVSDDGRGINRPRVQAIAVEKGILPADAQPTDDEIDNLIFAPGFSTAAAVSDVSGRGVGMDVVRRNILALGGRIGISSRPGVGSTFTLSLPLTLAVMDGMVVDVAGQTLVLPLTAIIESLRPQPAEVHTVGPATRLLAVRGEMVPLVDISAALGWSAGAAPCDGVVILVECEGGDRAALVVDAIQGQRQVVIKSLEANYRQVDGIAGATILGDGRVALILDVDALIALRRRIGFPSATLLAAE
jgi:two-component system chemotaxis sensor kinase CheA